MKTLIFDKSASRLQWISTKEIYREALKEFDAAVGIDPDDYYGRVSDYTGYCVEFEPSW